MKVSASTESDETGVTVPTPWSTTCDLRPDESEMLNKPVRTPVIVGLKAIAIVQFDAIAKAVRQVSTSEKSPLTLIPAIERGAGPIFDRVTVRKALELAKSWFPKLRLLAEMDNKDVRTPVPLRRIIEGDPELCEIVNNPERVPVIAGLNAIDTVQLPAGGRLLPHILV